MKTPFFSQLKNEIGTKNKLVFVRDTAEKFCISACFPFFVAFVAFVFHALALDLAGIMTFALIASLALWEF